MLREDDYVNISFDGESISFLCASHGSAVEVPSTAAAHSRLLADMRAEDITGDHVPIPLSMSCVEAWLAFLEVDQHGVVEDCGLSDSTLLQAVEAADFLQDEHSIAQILHMLSYAFDPAPQEDEYDTTPPTSQSEEEEDITALGYLDEALSDDEYMAGTIGGGPRCCCGRRPAGGPLAQALRMLHHSPGARYQCTVCAAAQQAASPWTERVRLQPQHLAPTGASEGAMAARAAMHLQQFFSACCSLGSPVSRIHNRFQQAIYAPGPAPTAAQCLRVQRILGTVSPSHILQILQGVVPTPDSAARFERDFPSKQAAVLHQLLLLVPPSLHAAVLHARCPSIARDRSLSLAHMPSVDAITLVPPRRCSTTPLALAAVLQLFGHRLDAVSGGGSGRRATGGPQLACEETLASMLSTAHDRNPRTSTSSICMPSTGSTTTVPTAASSCASESVPELTRMAEGHNALLSAATGLISPAGEEESDSLPSLSDIVPVAARDSAASLTRLSLSVAAHESRPAFTLVGHLSTLCALRLNIHSVERLDMLSFGTTLHALPALAALHVTAQAWAYWSSTSRDGTSLPHFFTIVSSLPALTSLGIEHCFNESRWKHPMRPRRVGASRAAIQSVTALRKLSNLTALTTLSLRENHVWQDDTIEALCSGLVPLTRLRQLSMPRGFDMPDVVHRDLLVHCLQGLAQLQRLDLTETPEPALDRLLVELASTAAMRGLTSLALERLPGLRSLSYAAAFIPQAFPSLQRLWCGSRLCDEGLQALATALPKLSMLRQLGLAGDEMSRVGLFAALAATEQLQRVDGRGLQCLRIAGVSDAADHSRPYYVPEHPTIVELLKRQTTLEELHLLDLDLNCWELCDVIEALSELPRLHTLVLSGNYTEAEDFQNLFMLYFEDLTALRRLAIHEHDLRSRDRREELRWALETHLPWLTAVTLCSKHLRDDVWVDASA